MYCYVRRLHISKKRMPLYKSSRTNVAQTLSQQVGTILYYVLNDSQIKQSMHLNTIPSLYLTCVTLKTNI